MGYHRAGFEVLGVDIRPQPRYPFKFIQADALEYLRVNVLPRVAWPHSADLPDAIHASPPCQHHANVTAWRGNRDDHPELISPTRDLLEAIGLPWVIENVPEAPVRPDFLLCGSMLALRIRRHRAFETNWSCGYGLQCRHQKDDYSFDHGKKQPESVYRAAMGCEWMTVLESREAIPPAYTEFIGLRLMEYVS